MDIILGIRDVFLRIIDSEMNRIELWEPVDHIFANEKQEEMR